MAVFTQDQKPTQGDVMTLDEWSKKHRILPTSPTTERGTRSLAISTDHPGHGELYHLTDYFVDRRNGVIHWLLPRDHTAAKMRDPNYVPTVSEALADPDGFVEGMTETKTEHKAEHKATSPSEITFDVPNLDCEWPDDLDEIEKVLLTLAYYAMHKASAIRHRRSGNISAAMAYETVCERLYLELPQWAKW